jgi:hypothetical protein
MTSATIVKRACPTQMIVFVPVNRPDVPKAIVILRNPHNHPMHPHTKPMYAERSLITSLVNAAGKTGLTVSKLLNGNQNYS